MWSSSSRRLVCIVVLLWHGFAYTTHAFHSPQPRSFFLSSSLLKSSSDNSDDDTSSSSRPARRNPKLEQAFWEEQQRVAALLGNRLNELDMRQQAKQQALYAKRSNALTSDTLFLAALGFCMLWILSPNPLVPVSFGLGSLLGTLYSFGLGKYVESLGSFSLDDAPGAGLGQARFAFLILLFIALSKFKSEGIEPIPAIGGFFIYQVGGVFQSLRKFEDDWKNQILLW